MTNTVSTATDDVERVASLLLSASHGVGKDGRYFDLGHASDTLRALVQERDRLREALRNIKKYASSDYAFKTASAALGE